METEYMLNSTPQRCILVKLTHDLTPGTVGNFVGLAEGNLENSKTSRHKIYNGPKIQSNS
jgi:peptidyl-prolyl cis-trans isomerase A (cyclophilin A)